MNQKTELIIFNRPNSGGLAHAITDQDPKFFYGRTRNPNNGHLPSDQFIRKSGQGKRVDLYEDVPIPVTYTIADIKEPDKRKTSWSKTIKIPGTANNNRIFKHIYDISGDGWLTIGNQSVYTNFNPNLRTEIILMNDGIQVLKGNLQLKNITKNKSGDIEYDIILTGDFTSLFNDLGSSKLNELNFGEWDHEWSKTNIINSWDGILKRNGATYSNTTYGYEFTITKLESYNNRMKVTTSLANGYAEGDFIKFRGYEPGPTYPYFGTIDQGVWQVAEILSTTEFTVNTPLPVSVGAQPTYPNVPAGFAYCKKATVTGTGYVYPLISWGDEYDFNSFPVTAMNPAYYVKEIWDKIFKANGSTYQSNFLDSQFFKRLIITQKKAQYELSGSEIYSREFLVGDNRVWQTNLASAVKQTKYLQFNTATSSATASYLATGQSAGSNPMKVPFSLETTVVGLTHAFFDGGNGTASGTASGANGNWDNSNYIWTVKDSGEYDLNVALTLEHWVDIAGINEMDGTYSVSQFINERNAKLAPKYTTGLLSPGTKTIVYVDIMRKKFGTSYAQSILQTSTLFDGSYANGDYSWYEGSPHWPQAYGRFQPTDWLARKVNMNPKGIFLGQGDQIYVQIAYYLQSNSDQGLLQVPFDSNPDIGITYPQGDVCAYFNLKYDAEGNYPGEYYEENLTIHGRPILRVKGSGVTSPNFISNKSSGKSTENSIIYGTQYLPKDMSCADFVKNIVKMFNLYIEPDREIEHLYYIEPRDDYYYDGSNATDFVDWTYKLDNSSVEMQPLAELNAKYYTFQNKPETDYWNKRFKDERGRDYMMYRKEITNDFLKNESKIEVSFGSTVMINNPEGSDVVMPAILQKEPNGAFKPLSNTLPRVLMWVGTRPCTARGGTGYINLHTTADGYYGWELLSATNQVAVGASATSRRYYPYAGTVDSPLDPFYDLNWYNMEQGDFVYWDYAKWSTHNLYNAYWKNFIDEISDPASMVIRGNFNLTAKDIYNLDFRKIYVIEGIWCRLQKVSDYNANGDELTKVELLKLKSPTRFVRQSLPKNTIVTNIADYTRPVTTSIIEVTPGVKSARDGEYTNLLPNSLGNSGTVHVNGQANAINDSRNVHITGSENLVGNGCENINIHGGNGISVAGGTKNVNIIGTSKIFVNESDVTYINGVRYKWGIPLSKSNVIDGGITTATSSLLMKRNTNTLPNIVDAGEDLVNKDGSATHENVITSGEDKVLPNLIDLGVTTTNTPNPKTNSQGGYIFSGTQSMVEIVRAARRPPSSLN